MNESAERLDWRRTSPVAVIFFILNTVRHFLVNGLPAMAVVITLYASSGDTVKSLVMTGLVVLAAAVAVGAVAKWARFRFCIDGDTETSDELLVPGITTAQASLVCASDTNTSVHYASTPLQISLTCDRGPEETQEPSSER